MSVSVFATGVLISRTILRSPGSTLPANTASWSVVFGRLFGNEPDSAACSIRSVEAISSPVAAIDKADPRRELAVAVDDVVAAATRDGVAAGAAEQDVAGAQDGAGDRAEARSGGRDDRCRARREGLRHDRASSPAIRSTPAWSSTSQPVKPAPPRRARGVLVAPDDVVERRAGVGLGFLPAVAVDDDLDRHADEVVVDLHVVVGRARCRTGGTPSRSRRSRRCGRWPRSGP